MDDDYDPRPHTVEQYLSSIYEELGRIEVQVLKTNGRVTRLERALLLCAGAALALGFTYIGPIIGVAI